jgi:hypothetical protein
MIDLNQFVEWQNELPYRRSVRIDIRHGNCQIHVWDNKYMVGQIVNSVEEIDLRNEAIKKRKRDLEELKELENEVNTNPTANLQQANCSRTYQGNS